MGWSVYEPCSHAVLCHWGLFLLLSISFFLIFFFTHSFFLSFTLYSFLPLPFSLCFPPTLSLSFSISLSLSFPRTHRRTVELGSIFLQVGRGNASSGASGRVHSTHTENRTHLVQTLCPTLGSGYKREVTRYGYREMKRHIFVGDTMHIASPNYHSNSLNAWNILLSLANINIIGQV